MGGIFGILDSRRETDTAVIIAKMAARISHQKWYRTHSFVDASQGVGLGRVSTGVFNSEFQPVYNEDDTLLIFMVGELYDYQDQKRVLEMKGHQFAIGNDPEFALHLYEQGVRH